MSKIKTSGPTVRPYVDEMGQMILRLFIFNRSEVFIQRSRRPLNAANGPRSEGAATRRRRVTTTMRTWTWETWRTS